MNSKKTLLVAVVFAAIVGIYMWDQGRIEKKETKEKAESRLVRPEKDKLDEISIINDGKAIELKKEAKDWMIVQPRQLRSDQSQIDQILTQLDTTARKDQFEVTDEQVKDYGLDDPELKVTVKSSGDSYSEEIQLGDKTTDGSSHYARVSSDKEVFTVPTAFRTTLAKSLPELRDKRLLPMDITQATTMTLTHDGGTYRVEKKNEDWQLIEPAQRAADKNKIEEILREWNVARAEDFIDTDTQESSLLMAYGLDQPQWKGTVYSGSADGPSSGTLFIGAEKTSDTTRVYAMAEGSPYIFTMNKETLDKLKPTLDDLRDKQLFTLTQDDVKSFLIKVRGADIPLEKDSAGLWHFSDDPEVRLDQGTVRTKLSSLLDLEVMKFIDGPTTPGQTGLEEPNVEAIVANADHTTTEGVITGRKDSMEDFVYARRLGSDELLGVDWKKPGTFLITRDDLIDKKLFDFEPEAAHKIVLHDGERELTLVRKEGGAWEGTPNGSDKTFQAGADKMNALLYSVTGLTWKARLDPSHESDMTLIKTQNLESPAKWIEFHDEKGEKLGYLGQGGESDRAVYVRRNDGDYFSVDKGRIEGMRSALDEVFASMGAEKPEEK